VAVPEDRPRPAEPAGRRLRRASNVSAPGAGSELSDPALGFCAWRRRKMNIVTPQILGSPV
jgi:hypothetical protein